jgi:hypothetical protein
MALRWTPKPGSARRQQCSAPAVVAVQRLPRPQFTGIEEERMSNDDKSAAPRGDAAWRAAKQAIAERNDAAHARVRKERAQNDAAMRARQVAAERREIANLPKQPGT